MTMDTQGITIYLSLIQSILPSVEEKDIEKQFKELNIDSIDLVTIRVEFEKLIGTTIPDNHWLNFSNFHDIIQYCEEEADIEKLTAIKKKDNIFKKNIRIDMPQMAIEGLSENWLFKNLGGYHWNLLCQGLNTMSSDLFDELGNRLYATFVRLRIIGNNSLFDFNENEDLNVKGDIERYGNSMYFSEFQLDGPDGKLITANLMTSFAVRKSTGNKELAKSQPNVVINSIKNLSILPDFGNEYRLIKKQQLDSIKIGAHVFQITDDTLFEIEYKMNPYYELNGAGLLYFAAYPIINDVNEAAFFNKQEISDTRWEQSAYTLSRDILYYANCDINDTIIYKLHSYEFIDDRTIKINSSLHRKSDLKTMAKLFSIKELRNEKGIYNWS